MKHRRPAIPPERRIASGSKQYAAAQAGSLPRRDLVQLVALFNAGRYVEVESRAGMLLAQHPDSGLAWKLLAASLMIQGKHGLPAMQKAAELLPEDAEIHGNLGIVLMRLERLDDAVVSYRRAVEIKPDYVGAHYNLGNTLMYLGRLDDAVASYRRALKIKPDFAQGHSNLGNALMDLGRVDDAVASYRRALEIEPDFAEVHGNLGNALKDLGRLDEAVASYRRALQVKPDYAGGHYNLGVALKDQGRLDDAVASYRRALEIKPDFAEAHYNLGVASMDLGNLGDAVASYRRALEFKPDFAEAHNNLGAASMYLGRLDDAVASYRRALESKPDYAEALSNLLFVHNYLSDQPAELLMADARRYGEIVARQARPYADWHNVPEADRCLRVGLVSGDLRNHPVGYFVEAVLAAVASSMPGDLEFLAYPSYFRSDALTERIKDCCRGWHSAAGLTDEGLARRIRDDGIDILIDLSGHTAHNRLPMFAWNPAPVQASWLGYFATTGVAAIDYLIADPWTLLETEDAHFTEKVWRLPETRFCFTPPDADVFASPLPGLSNGHVTFGCFNSLAKMNDAVVALWARILRNVTGSRLFLKAKQIDEAAIRQSIVSRFAAHGIDAARLILEGASPRAQYLAAFNRVDIALDPFPFTGGATSVEGLWMGVPVLTLAGDRFVSRQGVSLLMNAGLPDWIAANTDDYVTRAVSHAADLHRLATLRDGLREQVLASPLFDAARFAKHFEVALRGMWTHWCDRRHRQSSMRQVPSDGYLKSAA